MAWRRSGDKPSSEPMLVSCHSASMSYNPEDGGLSAEAGMTAGIDKHIDLPNRLCSAHHIHYGFVELYEAYDKLGDVNYHIGLCFSPGQNDRHFAADIFKCIFMEDKFCILI